MTSQRTTKKPVDAKLQLAQRLLLLLENADAADKQVGWIKRRRKLSTRHILPVLMRSFCDRLGLWATLHACGDGCTPASASGVRQALRRMPVAVLTNVLERMQTRTRTVPASKGLPRLRNGGRFIAVDGSSWPVVAKLGQRNEAKLTCGSKERWSVHVTGVADIATSSLLTLHVEPHKNEREGLLTVVGAGRDGDKRDMVIRQHDVVVCDRGYPSVGLLVALAERGIRVVMRLKKTSPFCDVGSGCKLRGAALKLSEQLPAGTRLRHVAFACGTSNSADELSEFHLLTTVSEEDASDNEIIQVYRGRWVIETLFRHVKTDLHAREARMRSLEGVQKELLVCLIDTTLITDTRSHTHGDLQLLQASGNAPSGTKSWRKLCQAPVAHNAAVTTILHPTLVPLDVSAAVEPQMAAATASRRSVLWTGGLAPAAADHKQTRPASKIHATKLKVRKVNDSFKVLRAVLLQVLFEHLSAAASVAASHMVFHVRLNRPRVRRRVPAMVAGTVGCRS